MALVGIELVTHVSEPDALTTQPPPCAFASFNQPSFANANNVNFFCKFV